MEKLLEILVGYLTFGYSQRGKKDRKVFDLLMKELAPDSAAINLLKDHDMGAPFKYEIITPLNNAAEDWENIDRRFLISGIEKRKNMFLLKLKEFLTRFSERSGGVGHGFISIGLRDLEDRPEMMKYKDQLNKLGTESYNLYVEFVEYAHKKLPA